MNALVCKEYLRGKFHDSKYAVDEYIETAEDQDGKEYWNQFQTLEPLGQDFKDFFEAGEFRKDAEYVAEMVLEMWATGDLRGYLGDNPQMGPMERSNHDVIAWAHDNLITIIADAIKNNVTTN